MSVRVLPVVAEVYQQIRLLPESCRPCWVVREDGATLVAVDPRTTQREAVEWTVDNLTLAERDALRRAWGAGPTGTPCPDEWMTDALVLPWVPESVRLKVAQRAETA